MIGSRTSHRTRRWLLRGLLLAATVPLLAIGTLAVTITRYGMTDRARPADVIIVLGGGEPGTTRRAQHAAALYHAGYAPVILCTGGGPAEHASTEAHRCAQVVQAAGVPADAVLLETTSRSTAENARETEAIMGAHGWQDGVLVSDNFHLWRARWLFEARHLRVYPSPAQQTTGSLPPGETIHAVLREVAAWSVQVLPYRFDE